MNDEIILSFSVLGAAMTDYPGLLVKVERPVRKSLMENHKSNKSSHKAWEKHENKSRGA